jgi:hypothetical protein
MVTMTVFSPLSLLLASSRTVSISPDSTDGLLAAHLCTHAGSHNREQGRANHARCTQVSETSLLAQSQVQVQVHRRQKRQNKCLMRQHGRRISVEIRIPGSDLSRQRDDQERDGIGAGAGALQHRCSVACKIEIKQSAAAYRANEKANRIKVMSALKTNSRRK